MAAAASNVDRCFIVFRRRGLRWRGWERPPRQCSRSGIPRSSRKYRSLYTSPRLPGAFASDCRPGRIVRGIPHGLSWDVPLYLHDAFVDVHDIHLTKVIVFYFIRKKNTFLFLRDPTMLISNLQVCRLAVAAPQDASPACPSAMQRHIIRFSQQNHITI